MKLSPRKAFAISKVAVAVALWTKERIVSARITMNASGPTILRAVKTEKYLETVPAGRPSIDRAAEMIRTECRPITDHRSNEEYRREMTGVLLERGLSQLLRI